MSKPHHPNDIVKSCYKMESGLRLGQEGIHACQLGPFSSPIYFTEEEASKRKITKQDLIEKREWIFNLLNDEHSKTPCKGCSMVVEKPFKDVRFDLLGHMDLAAATTCNLRCNFCAYTHFDSFADAKYDALSILNEFAPSDVTWNSAVDFNGGEPTLLSNFDEYIEYFRSRRTRVFLFTNGLIYKQSVYDGLVNGTVRWAIVSLDAGTPSTYKKMKLSPKFNHVLENIARYSEAGSKGGGNCSVKYIFHEDNSNDDDVSGFCYSMLALRPQEVWLTFDFEPLCNLPADSPDLGGHDYSKHVEAYAKTYLMLEQHGLKAVHYAEKHLAPASAHGVILLDMVKQRIDKIRRHKSPSLVVDNFRVSNTQIDESADGHFRVKNGVIEFNFGKGWSSEPLVGKSIIIAPASPQINQFVSLLQTQDANIIAIVDRDKVLHGKDITGVPITSREKMGEFDLDMAFVATSNTVIEPQIISTIRKENPNCKIVSFSHEQSTEVDRPTVIKRPIEAPPLGPNGCNTSHFDHREAIHDLVKWARHTPN